MSFSINSDRSIICCSYSTCCRVNLQLPKTISQCLRNKVASHPLSTKHGMTSQQLHLNIHSGLILHFPRMSTADLAQLEIYSDNRVSHVPGFRNPSIQDILEIDSYELAALASSHFPRPKRIFDCRNFETAEQPTGREKQ